MRRRGREAGDEPRGAVLNAPFADLGKRLRTVLRFRLPPRAATAVTRGAGRLHARHGGRRAARRGSDGRVAGPPPAGAGRRPVSEEAEALALLSDLVEGGARFDISDTREYVEGAIVGLDPRVLRRLRRGDYAWQATSTCTG
jgi:hypothetical protein